MNKIFSRAIPANDTAILFYLALSTLLVHFLTNGGYGYFRDEFYYIACGQHLAWGYVDQPPFAALMAFLTGHLLGDSLFALRFFPAVCGALVVLLTGLMARELGAGRFAQCLAATAVLVAPLYLGINNYFSMNCFDHLFWALAAYLVIRILKEDRPRLWLLFGLVAGLGLMNKYSMGFFLFGLAVGLVLTSARKYFASRWLWSGGALALVIFLPHILWEIRWGFPTREFIHNATLYKNAPMSPLAFLGATILDVHPFTLPIWLAGLYFFLWSEMGKAYRVMGWIYVAVLALLLFTRSKPYYFGPAYFMLFASGAVVIENFLRRRDLHWLKPASFALLLAGGLITAPFVLPMLPVESFIRYQNFLGLKPPREERDKPGQLPQQYADMFGWENLVATVAEVYNRLSPEEKARCLIFCDNYGEAGAIDFFGKKYGLPRASSGHNNYWFWGPQNPNADIVITVGESRRDVEKTFNEVELAATVVSQYARSFETNLPIYIGRDPKLSLKDVWPRTKDFI
jgi:dolichyl-phosphate-mannose-protein mannosyltransferase